MQNQSSSGVAPVVTTVVAIVLIGGLGGLATQIGPWYQSLLKPAWQPPDWLFGPVWTLIYCLSGVAAVRAWRRANSLQKNQMLWLWIVNGLLNVFWSVLFFSFRRPDFALLELLALWTSILALMAVFFRVDKPSSWLMVPYLGWVSFAGLLNFAVARLNGFV
jgi:translocator protein